MLARSFSTGTQLFFKKESVTQFNNVLKAASGKVSTPKKWQPTNGNSFRSFAEYRLKVTNQSPLAIKSKSKN